jgi:hypothetical protein
VIFLLFDVTDSRTTGFDRLNSRRMRDRSTELSCTYWTGIVIRARQVLRMNPMAEESLRPATGFATLPNLPLDRDLVSSRFTDVNISLVWTNFTMYGLVFVSRFIAVSCSFLFEYGPSTSRKSALPRSLPRVTPLRLRPDLWHVPAQGTRVRHAISFSRWRGLKLANTVWIRLGDTPGIVLSPRIDHLY